MYKKRHGLLWWLLIGWWWWAFEITIVMIVYPLKWLVKTLTQYEKSNEKDLNHSLKISKVNGARYHDVAAIMNSVDTMEGHLFEKWCANLLRANGFSNIIITPGSGDQGVDIIASLNEEKYAIQCKRYSGNLSNRPVQEVIAGKAFYGCDKGAVMTNQYFTPSAKELAKKTKIELWDRTVLSALIRNVNN